MLKANWRFTDVFHFKEAHGRWRASSCNTVTTIFFCDTRMFYRGCTPPRRSSVLRRRYRYLSPPTGLSTHYSEYRCRPSHRGLITRGWMSVSGTRTLPSAFPKAVSSRSGGCSTTCMSGIFDTKPDIGCCSYLVKGLACRLIRLTTCSNSDCVVSDELVME